MTVKREATQTPPSSAAQPGSSFPRKAIKADRSLLLGEKVSATARGRMRESLRRLPVKGDHVNFALISRLRAAASPKEPLRSDREPSPLGERCPQPRRGRMTFSPWGRRCPRPRPRTDEGRACGGCPLKGRLRKLRPHQPPAGGSFPRRGSL